MERPERGRLAVALGGLVLSQVFWGEGFGGEDVVRKACEGLTDAELAIDQLFLLFMSWDVQRVHTSLLPRPKPFTIRPLSWMGKGGSGPLSGPAMGSRAMFSGVRISCLVLLSSCGLHPIDLYSGRCYRYEFKMSDAKHA